MSKSEVFKDGRGGFRFRLKASNGETVASGRELKDARRCPLWRGDGERAAEDVTIEGVK